MLMRGAPMGYVMLGLVMLVGALLLRWAGSFGD